MPHPLNAHNRTDVDFAPSHKVKNYAEEKYSDEHGDGPVEVLQRDRRRVGPERPEECEAGVHQSNHVHGHTKAPQTPTRLWQKLGVVQPPVEYAADRDGVGKHKGYHLQRDNRVKGLGRADVDQGKQSADEAWEKDGVGWDLARRVNGRDPACKGQAIVTRKGKGLTRRRGIEGDVAGNDEYQDHDGEGVDAACWNRFLEYVNEGISRWVVDRVFNGRDREDKSDDEDEGEEAVADVTPYDGVGHISPGILYFFRHVGRRVRACMVLSAFQKVSETTPRLDQLTNRTVDGRYLADHERQTDGGPSSEVGEVAEHSRGRLPRRQDPQDDDHNKKAEHVYDEQQILNHRQTLGAKNITGIDERHHGEHQQCSLPSLPGVVWVVDSYQPLNYRPCEKGTRCGAGLPREHWHPS